MLQLPLVLEIPPRLMSWAALLVSLWHLPHQDKDLGRTGTKVGAKEKCALRKLPPSYCGSMHELGCCYVIVNPQTWV